MTTPRTPSQNPPPVIAGSRAAASESRLRFLEQYRELMQAVLRGDPLDVIAHWAVQALATALGERANVLLLVPLDGWLDIVGSTGPEVRILIGLVPSHRLPEVGAAEALGERLTIRVCGIRHPFTPRGRAYIAPVNSGNSAMFALAAYLPADARFPDTHSITRAFDDVATALAGVRRPNATPERPGGNALGGPLSPGGSLAGQPWHDDTEFFQAVLDALPYALTVVGPDANRLLQNRAAHERNLAPPLQLQPMTGGAHTAPPGGTIPPGTAAWGGSGEDAPYAARYRVHDPVSGRDRWEATTAVPLRLRDGTLAGVVSLTHDMTRAAEAEEEREWLLQEMQSQRELLDRLVESAPVSILLLDRELRVRLANNRVLAMLPRGAQAGGVLGHVISDLAPRAAARWFQQTVKKVVEQRSEVRREELPLRSRGSVTYWDIAAAPLHEASGAVTGVLFSAHDVTARVTARRMQTHLLHEVRAERARFQTILDLIPIGVVAVDDTFTTFTCVNQAALALATRPGAAVGGPVRTEGGEVFWDIVDPDGRSLDRGESPLRRAHRDRTVIQPEQLLIRRASGQLTPIMESAAPLPGKDGTPAGAVAVLVDITLLKELEQLKDDFVAVASHDLRSPLTVVNGRLQMIRRQLTANRTASDTTLQMLNVVLEHVQQLNDLAAALLDVTRIQSGRFQVNRAPVDLAAVVQRVTGPLAQASARHTVSVHVPNEGLIGEWEAARIAQVVQNLVQNAIKYSPDGGPVAVHVERGELNGMAAAVLSVTDRGIGIPAEERAHVFERFARGDGARRRDLSGSGLGLYICRGIVQAHGGTIAVDAAPHGGSIFTVLLPIEQPRPRETAAQT